MSAVTSSGAGAEVLRADCVSKRLGGRLVLSSATLQLRAGTVTGLLGRMGTGKSTLLRICAGLLESDGGWVRFRGRQHQRPRLAELARDGLYFLGDQRALVSRLTLRAHLELVARRFGSGGRSDAVELLRVAPLLDVRTGALSGGERRRAEVALAMTRAPHCLLADEPFRGIDPLAVELLGTAFRELAGRGCAVVVTGHELPSIVPYVDEVVWMTAGTTHPLGTPEAAWRHHAFQREYLGPGAVAAGPPGRAVTERA